MKDSFDIEQSLLDTWGIIDDIKMLMEWVCDSEDFAGMDPNHMDKIANYLLGLDTVYSLKFDRLWRNVFENGTNTRNTDIMSAGDTGPRGPSMEKRK